MPLLFTYCFFFFATILLYGQPGNVSEIRYSKVAEGYVMVLKQGDDIMQELEKFVVEEKIPSANFTGMGFVNITFGFYDKQSKTYVPKDFKDVELASMHGTIAFKDDRPSIHAHGVAGDRSFQTVGGHILSATVSTGSVEIFIVNHNKMFVRKKDETLGADVLRLE